jgi:hypothetical protein
MTISTTITAELASLQAQVIAAAPLANASHATIVALQLNAGQLVADVQAALLAPTNLDNWIAPADPAAIASALTGIYGQGLDQSNLSLMRGVTGRAASNLDQL